MKATLRSALQKYPDICGRVLPSLVLAAWVGRTGTGRREHGQIRPARRQLFPKVPDGNISKASKLVTRQKTRGLGFQDLLCHSTTPIRGISSAETRDSASFLSFARVSETARAGKHVGHAWIRAALPRPFSVQPCVPVDAPVRAPAFHLRCFIAMPSSVCSQPPGGNACVPRHSGRRQSFKLPPPEAKETAHPVAGRHELLETDLQQTRCAKLRPGNFPRGRVGPLSLN